jgi:hypothetical protein
LGKTSPNRSISVLLNKTAKIRPFLPKVFVKTAVIKEDNPMFTNKLPKTMADKSRVGYLRSFFTALALGFLSESLRRRKLLKEKIAVSEAEKNADRNMNITIRPTAVNMA